MKQDPPQISYRSQGNASPGSNAQQPQSTLQHLGPYLGPVPLESPSRLQAVISEQPEVKYRPHPAPLTGTEVPSVASAPLEPEERQQPPLLEFSVFYNVQCQSLSVHLLRATKLPESRRKTIAPFVTVHLLPTSPDVLKSKILSNTLDLEWDEKFTFSGLPFEKIPQQTLVFRVYSHNGLSRDDFLGGVVLPLAEADVYGVPVQKSIEDSVIDFQVCLVAYSSH